MSAKNDITGDAIKSKPNTKAFEDNFDKIFGKKKPTYIEDWQSPDRDKAIAQNGNTGEHYLELYPRSNSKI